MATLTLNQANNANQLYNPYTSFTSSYASYSPYYFFSQENIEKTAKGWYVVESYNSSNIVYGAFSGTGIAYDSNGRPVLGIITSARSIDVAGATNWTVSQVSIAATDSSSLISAIGDGEPFLNSYIINTILLGNDSITGSAGNDVIFYSTGSDIINGGTGNDWMDFSSITRYSAANSLKVNLALGNYQVTNSSVISFSHIINVENILGSDNGGTLIGNAAHNIIIGGDSDDAIRGGGGNDTMSGGVDGVDIIDGGTGVDTVSYAINTSVVANLEQGDAVETQSTYTSYRDTLTNIENLIGSAYNDKLTGNAGNNVLTGGAGNDFLEGKLGSDTTNYSTAYQRVSVNLMTGIATGQGTDTLSNIENANGSIYGDTLIGNAVANILNGNGGNDVFSGGAGNDTLRGGLGIDQANYNTARFMVAVNIGLLTAQNTKGAGIDTLSGIENLLGSHFNDVLTGDSFANKLKGGIGNDALNGGLGNDSLIGGAGSDTLNGGLGNDVLIGGIGADRMTGGVGIDNFVFNSIPESVAGVSKDVITDFVHGIDKINLATIDANVFAAGNQAFTLISSSAAFNSTGQIKLSAGILSGDATGDGVADFQIALTGVTSLTATDFVL